MTDFGNDLVTFFCTFSNISISDFLYDVHTLLQWSKCNLTKLLYTETQLDIERFF